MSNENKEGLVGAFAFNLDNENLIEVDEKSKVVKKVMTPEEFAKNFLIDRVVNQNTRKVMRDRGMDRWQKLSLFITS